MPHDSPAEFTEIVMEAVRLAGTRAILSCGWTGMIGKDQGKNAYVADGPLPHDTLFPRLAAVVHHGGAGTVATAARAGVAQIVVPHMTDQFYWAARVARLGLGPKAVWRSRLTSQRLARAILETVHNPSFHQQTKNMAAALRGQTGTDAVVRFLESESTEEPGLEPPVAATRITG